MKPALFGLFGRLAAVALMVAASGWLGLACGSEECPEGKTRCRGQCVSLASESSHCGACGIACAPGEACQEGACVSSCPQGQERCGERCVDPLADRDHCGGCDLSCAADEVCDGAGACAPSCGSGLLACDGGCVDPFTNRAYCGATGSCQGADAGTACAGGEVCANGTCAPACPGGGILCEGLCVDPSTSRTHCGASGSCIGAEAGVACEEGYVCDGAGQCELSCQAGFIVCDDRCVDPLESVAFCGASGDCTGADAGERCASHEHCDGGQCQPICAPSEIICEGRCVDPVTDQQFCGASGSCAGAETGENCALVPGQRCVSGACSLILPVTNQVAISADGVVTLQWTVSATPGFGQTRLVRRQGTYPTGPNDGELLAVTGTGVEAFQDLGVGVAETWYYALFATDGILFSVAAFVGTSGTFVDGRKTCQPGELLRGLDLDNNIFCQPPSIDVALHCVQASTTPGRYQIAGTATCPANYSITGGGFRDVDPLYYATTSEDWNSAPSDSDNSWWGWYSNEGAYHNTNFGMAGVCCAAKPSLSFPSTALCPGSEIVVGFDPNGGFLCGAVFPTEAPLDCENSVGSTVSSAGESTATCQTGYQATGGGFLDFDPAGFSGPRESYPLPGVTAWRSRHYDVTTYRSIARCCRAADILPLSTAAMGSCPVGQAAQGVAWTGGVASLVCRELRVEYDLSCRRVNSPGGYHDAYSLPCPTQSAWCGGGEWVVGGGFSGLENQSTSEGPLADWSSEPASGLNGWRVNNATCGYYSSYYRFLPIAYGVCCRQQSPVLVFAP